MTNTSYGHETRYYSSYRGITNKSQNSKQLAESRSIWLIPDTVWIVPWMYWHLNGTVEAQTWRFHCSSFMCERLNQMDKYWKRTYTFKSLYWLTATVCFAIQEFVCREISRGIFRFCWCLLLCFVLRVQMYDQLTWSSRLNLLVIYICGNSVHMITFAHYHL